MPNCSAFGSNYLCVSFSHERKSERKFKTQNPIQRKTLPEIKAGVSITYCEVFGSSRRRSIAQVMNYQSGHSGRNYWNLFQILITMPKTTTFQKKTTLMMLAMLLWCMFENCVFDSIHLRSTKIKWFARRLTCLSHVNHQLWILNQHFFYEFCFVFLPKKVLIDDP